MSASWYDVLGVAPEASEEEIRAAWREATADLEPTDRRFDLYNQAAKVLLDTQARAAYDREQDAPVVEPVETESAAVVEPVETGATSVVEPVETESAPHARGGVPTWLLAALALAVLLVGGFAGYVQTRDTDADTPSNEAAVREAKSVLEQSFGNVLTYRWDDLETAHQRAVAVLTPQYRCEFDKVWAVVLEKAEQVKAVVRTDVLRSGVTAVSDDGDRVQLVAVIRNQASNAGGDQGVGTLMLGVTMVHRDGTWLIDDVDGLEGGDEAAAGDPCGSAAPSESPSE
ncbi:J domain-containing protein [Nocardioides daejeonensis]|uniref:J domain-containing protein n=1 Tax=Nocardioides daejeonensis TaxID=1046556 RepID=UPI000D7481F6|nr:DnaJ domain-containing protein [Nocardioides daejeonensis]